MTVRIDVKRPFLSTEGLAKALNVTEATVRKLIETGQLRAFKIGRVYRISEDDLNAYLSDVSTAGPVKTVIVELEKTTHE